MTPSMVVPIYDCHPRVPCLRSASLIATGIISSLDANLGG
jgi:hypothetical protein